MINYFYFGSYQSKRDCGLVIEKRPRKTTPIRDFTLTHVPGRDGDVYIDNGCYQNIELAYSVGCSNVDSNITKIREMLSQPGYMHLRDSYDLDKFYIACVANPGQFEEDLLNFGHATVIFNAEPYRYEYFGYSTSQTFATSGSSTKLTNPYKYSAKPKFHIEGSGGVNYILYVTNNSVQIGYPFKIPTGKTGLYIDCETETVYSGNENLISSWSTDSFPMLEAGTVNLIVSGGATKAEVWPRWRTL